MELLPQSRIPTLTSLYDSGDLSANPTTNPLHPPSSDLNTRIGLIRYDITKLSLPNGAIVNAANRRLLGGAGVDGAIHRAAGSELLHECRGLGGAETGEAKITKAYKLPCKNVIHTVGPVYGTRGAEDSEKMLASCYGNSLRLAVENGLDAIAFSAVSTGVYGYPSKEAARTAARTVREFLDGEDGKKLSLIVFVNFEMKDVIAYEEVLPEYFPPVGKVNAEATENTQESNEAEVQESGEAKEESGKKTNDAEKVEGKEPEGKGIEDASEGTPKDASKE